MIVSSLLRPFRWYAEGLLLMRCSIAVRESRSHVPKNSCEPVLVQAAMAMAHECTAHKSWKQGTVIVPG